MTVPLYQRATSRTTGAYTDVGASNRAHQVKQAQADPSLVLPKMLFPLVAAWESQWATSSETPTGQRYIEHRQRGSEILLFVRRHKKIAGQTEPYCFLGPCDYVRHEGEKPMGVVWKLRRPMPSDLFLESKVLAG